VPDLNNKEEKTELDEKFDDLIYDSKIDEDDLIKFENKTSKRKRAHIPPYLFILPILSLIIIIFAFITEARNNRQANTPDNIQPATDSSVQADIYGLDWIVQELLPINRFSRPGTKLEQINGIVIHNIGNPGTTAMQNRNYFANVVPAQEIFISSNFIICLDGTIIQCIPVDEIAYASNERNDDTLSIEVCHPDDTGKFTEESYAATVRLTAWLCVQFDLTSNDVIRHFDVRGKECPRYFVVNEDAWERFKNDVQIMINEMNRSAAT